MVDRIVRSMDITPLMDTYDGTGAPPYSPIMIIIMWMEMEKLYLS